MVASSNGAVAIRGFPLAADGFSSLQRKCDSPVRERAAGSLNRSATQDRDPVVCAQRVHRPEARERRTFGSSRRFYIKERMNVEFFAEAFNLFNRNAVTSTNNTILHPQRDDADYNTTFAATTEASGNLYRERSCSLPSDSSF